MLAFIFLFPLVPLLLVGGTGAAVGAALSKKEPGQSEIKELEKDNAELRRRLERLEERNAS